MFVQLVSGMQQIILHNGILYVIENAREVNEGWNKWSFMLLECSLSFPTAYTHKTKVF